MNYSNFITRVTKVAPLKPAATVYPAELLHAVEVLHFEKRRDLKTIALELRKEPEWAGHSFAALHSACSRHCRKVATKHGLPRRASYTKPKRA